MNMDSFLVDSLALTTLTKVLVDMTKLSGLRRPNWLWPSLALCYAIICSILFLLASPEPVSSQTVAFAILKAIVSAGSAVGVTELQKAAKNDSLS